MSRPDQIRPGQIIREARLRHGLSQTRLARRAGTSQGAISRLERGELSPTFETFNTLLLVMGERADLTSKRIESDYDPVHMANTLAQTPVDRLKVSLSWNRMAGQFAVEGRKAIG